MVRNIVFKLLYEWPPRTVMPEHTGWERETVTAPSTVIHSRTARAGLRWWAVIGLVLAAIVLGLFWTARQPSRQLRSAEALLAEAYSQQRGFELRLPDAAYAPIQSRQEKADSSAFSRP